jgi:hypothetical protein
MVRHGRLVLSIESNQQCVFMQTRYAATRIDIDNFALYDQGNAQATCLSNNNNR